MFRKIMIAALGSILVAPCASFAQKENNTWYSPFVSLDFNPVPEPVFIPPPAIPANGQPVSMSDSAGALLFYSNGNVVYGKDHLPMPDGILANGAAERFNLHPCSALILPKSGSQYYLFSLLPDSISVDLPDTVSTQYMIQPSLYYSVIDMQLNGGNGDIVPGSKKILLQREVMRGFLVGSKGSGCDSAWVAVHDRQAPVFLSYPVTASGVGNAVISSTGANYLPDNRPGYGFYYGKFSPDSRRIALFSWRRSLAMPIDPGTYASLELVDFDPQTGIFSNAASLYENLDFSPFMYGFFPMAFSPDNTKLYTVQRTDYDVATWNDIVQYDLAASTMAAVLLSEQVVGTVPPVGLGSSPFLTDMRLGSDDKIYIAAGDIFPMSTGGVIPLARINNPNATGAGTVFESGLASPLMEKGFPMLFPAANILREGAFTFAGNTLRLCAGGPLTIGASKNGKHLWNTGSSDSGIAVTQPGTYWVHTEDDCLQHADTFRILPSINTDLLPGDTTVCQGVQWSITLPVYPGVQYTWQDGSTGPDYRISQEGLIVVSAQSNCPPILDSMRITYHQCHCDYLFVPTAFSPNADGLNDVFKPEYPCTRNVLFYELRIYNRWGQRVFESRTPEQGWNGLMNGQATDLGVYHYTVQVQAEGNSETLFRAGQVTLLH